MDKYISFVKIDDNLVNIIYQYLLTKILSIKYGHIYIDKITSNNKIIINETNYNNISEYVLKNNNIEINGYFSKYRYFIKYKKEIIDIINDKDNYITYNDKKLYLYDIFNLQLNIELNDIVVYFNNNDINYDYYNNILNNENYNNLYIILENKNIDVNKIKLEGKYYIINEHIEKSIYYMKNCKKIIHYNDNFSWLISLISEKDKRYINDDNLKISDTDIIIKIDKIVNKLINNIDILPLPYSIVIDEILDIDEIVKNKHIIISDIIPGESLTYRFKSGEEELYNKHYRECYFAFTTKKGGWDCLRHYEIIKNGCIPIFKNLKDCPKDIMITYPKELIIESNNKLLPWRNNIELYKKYLKEIYNNFIEKCSVDYSANYILKNYTNVKNVLLIRCHEGVNYSRELTWIGIKNYINKINGIAIEYPKINYLYKNYNGDLSKLHGFGYNYSKKLDDDYNYTDNQIIDKINNKFWDLIIFGKVGPDELKEGTIPNLPLWNIISKNYNKDNIIFIYGGDELNNMQNHNKYSSHIKEHSKYGICYVRELIL